METSDVHRALERLAERLAELDIPYAIVDAMALNGYGYRRTTEDVDVLLHRDGLAAFKEAHLGRGYIPGSKGLRDATCNVAIDVVLTGELAGDGEAKPVAFPDPAEAAVVGERFAMLPLATLIELKLASGMTAPHRLRDLADVLELIRIHGLTEDDAASFDPFVRDKYLELCRAARTADD